MAFTREMERIRKNDLHKIILLNRIKPMYFYSLLPQIEKSRAVKRVRAWAKRNPEKVGIIQKRWRHKKGEAWRISRREYYQKNKEKINLQVRKRKELKKSRVDGNGVLSVH